MWPEKGFYADWECPFCHQVESKVVGTKSNLRTGENLYAVECQACQARGPDGFTSEVGAWIGWVKRVDPRLSPKTPNKETTEKESEIDHVWDRVWDRFNEEPSLRACITLCTQSGCHGRASILVEWIENLLTQQDSVADLAERLRKMVHIDKVSVMRGGKPLDDLEVDDILDTPDQEGLIISLVKKS